jgi:signal transduction histidine kinase
VRKDGTRFWASVTITALRNQEGTLIGFAKVTRDLTQRRDAELKLRELAAERAALAEKARIQEFQERFIAILGHDLRNPLAAIEMGATLLRQQFAKEPASTRILDRLDASAGRMTRMIEQILDLTRSRLAGGLEVSPAPMDLSAMLTAVVEEVRAGHPSRTIELRCPALVGTWDRDRLEQVFSNLVSNAVHYGGAESPVSVEARSEGELIRVYVHNDGAPIPDELQGKLFDPFRRGTRDSRTPNTAGLGLGLYISRELVVAHGGDIDVRSSAAEGTTFCVSLPMTMPDRRHHTQTAMSETSAR